jgi:TrmH family RNA methyltransferase
VAAHPADRDPLLKHITSRDNPFFKDVAKLSASSRERRKRSLTLLDGVHLIEAYRDRFGAPKALIVSEEGAADAEVQALVASLAPLSTMQLSNALFRDVSSLATPTGIIAVIATPLPERVPDTLDSCVMLDGVQDPGNLGSILRSAAAAGVVHAFLSADCAFVWSPRVIRAGMGAHFRLAIHEHADLLSLAGRFRGTVLATTVDAPISLFDVDLTGPVALLIGNEGAGLSPALAQAATRRVTIPMPGGGVESLNAAAAAAICLFERVRQRRRAGI